ncbi:MAG: LamG-like jellyroll fold domain-containing protein [Vicinamibacteria bacterium]
MIPSAAPGGRAAALQASTAFVAEAAEAGALLVESEWSTAHDGDDDDDRRALLPVLECVVRNADDSYTAHFGYRNRTASAFSAPVGPANFFSPGPAGRSQPTSFAPGRSPYHPQAAFTVPFTSGTLVWSLRGPDGRTRTVKARTTSPRCGAADARRDRDHDGDGEDDGRDHDGHHGERHDRGEHRGCHHHGDDGTPPAPAACGIAVFGPERFTRTTGPKTVYDRSFAVPGFAVAPYALAVENGEPTGAKRVSSASILLNGAAVAGPSDLSQQVPGFTREVALAPTNALRVELASKPGSYLTLKVCGQNGDLSAPEIAWIAPAPGSAGNQATPALLVRYLDPGGVASGLDLGSLRVLVDGVDRSGLFTARSDEASAAWPAELAFAEGVHTLVAEIDDVAGNHATASASFTVDLTPPSLGVAEPAEGAVLASATVPVRLGWQDVGSSVDVASLSVLVNGSERASAFTRDAAGAVATLDETLGIVPGPNQIVARVRDAAGNPATAAVAFRVDVSAPAVAIDHPAAGSTLGAPDVEVAISYADDQALDVASFTATLDGQPVTLAQDAAGAFGTLTIPDGAHTLAVSIRDAAGNLASAQAAFGVDTAAPDVRILQPESGAILGIATPLVVITLSDAQGIDAASLRVTVDGVDRTSLFSVEAGVASALLDGGAALADGEVTLAAEVLDLAGNRGAAASTFRVDTTPPTAAFVAPAPTREPQPALRFDLADSGSGLDATTLQVLVDGVDVSARFALDAQGAAGTPAVPLADGRHAARVEIRDRAGNLASAYGSFVVDTLGPAVAIVGPAPDSFVNDPTPELRVVFADLGRDVANGEACAPGSTECAEASGSDVSSLRLYLRAGEPGAPETDVTSALLVRDDDALGALPVPLGDGSYRLRAVLADAAGNVGESESAFELDTIAPAVVFAEPADGAYVPSRTPGLRVTYSDGRSGVAPSLFRAVLDGIDRTPRFTAGESEATGALLAEESLGEGLHSFEVTVVDRAGNSTLATAGFGVDTLTPTIAITPAPGAFVGASSPEITLLFADPSDPGAPDTASGVDPGSTRILVDGVDRTADFVLTGSGGAATLPEPFADGAHTVRVDVYDYAANTGSALSTFTVDTAAPGVAPEAPGQGGYVAELQPDGTLVVRGSLSDLDPGVTVECRVGTTSVAGTVSAGQFTCQVPSGEGALGEGRNDVSVTATDTTGHSTTTSQTVYLDRAAPAVTVDAPLSGDATALAGVSVSGTAIDASPVSVQVLGAGGVPVPAVVSAGGACQPGASEPAASCTFTYVASNVPVGDATPVELRAVATDAAGNESSAAVSLRIDRLAPVVAITAPGESSTLSGASIHVIGSVADDTETFVEVNGIPALCSGQSSCPAGGASFETDIPSYEGALSIQAVARDAAGNVGAAEVQVRGDSTAPLVALTAPAAGFVSAGTAVEVAGVVTDASSVTLAGLVTSGGVATPFVCAASGEPAGTGPFACAAPLLAEGTAEIALSATDAAGNAAAASVTVVVDRTAPALAIVAPTAGAAIGALPVVVQGTASDATAVSVTVDGEPASVTGSAWQASITALTEGDQVFTVVARDAAGNETTRTVAVVVDLGPPAVSIDAPAPGALTREASIDVHGTVGDRSAVSVVVSGGVTPVDAVVTPLTPGAFGFTASGVALAEGDTTLVVTATDATGRASSAQVLVTRDSTPPVLELVVPDRVSRGRPGSAAVTASDTQALDRVTLRVTCVASGGGASCVPVEQTFTAPPFALALAVPDGAQPGDTLAVEATAWDRAGNSASATRGVLVTSDGVLTGAVLADDTGLPLSGATASLLGAPGSPALGVATSDERGRYSLPSSQLVAVLRVEKPGLTAAERRVEVASGAGTVPVDARLRPLAAAFAVPPEGGVWAVDGFGAGLGSADSGTGSGTGSSAGGSGADGASQFEPGLTTVPTGAALALVFAPGAGGTASDVRVTALSPQGLPGLLPLGWSPLAALELRAGEGATPPSILAAVAWGAAGPLARVALPAVDDGSGSPVPPAGPFHLVRYDFEMHEWRMVSPGLAAAAGVVSAALPSTGAFALVVADSGEPPIAVPAVDEPLEGVPMAAVPVIATGTGSVDPAVISPSGGTATGSLAVAEPGVLPSGSVIQVDVTESYSLRTGDQASEEKRLQDVLLYRATPAVVPMAGRAGTTSTGTTGDTSTGPGASGPATCATGTLCAILPITPSRTYATADLVEGTVHLDILAGREGVRGTVAGSQAITLDAGTARLSLPTGALDEDSALSIEVPASLSPYLPNANGLTPLAEVVLDFGGRSLLTAAELSVESGAASEGDTLLVARVVRIDDIPRFETVALAEVVAGRVVSRPAAGLPGVAREGRYAIFRSAAAVGLVTGVVTAGGSPVKASVETSAWPFTAFGRTDGRYTLVAPAGSATITARVAGTSLVGSASVVVPAPDAVNVPQSVTLDLALAGSVTPATVTPADGGVAVGPNAPLEIASPIALNPATAIPANVALVRLPPESSPGDPEQPVAVRLVLSGSAKTLSVIPQAALAFGMRYRLNLSGLADAFGGAVAVPATTFRTRDDVAPEYQLDAIAFSFPDENGLVKVTAPAGTLPPGTSILIINAGSGGVATFTAENDGSLGTLVPTDFPASIDDQLFVTVTDPLGNSITFTRSKYVNEATGETAIGPGGGTVTGPGGVELRIPEGALDKGVSFKLSLVPEAEYPALFPNGQLDILTTSLGGHHGSLLKIETSAEATFKKEVDVAFPVPDFTTVPEAERPPTPGDAFFYVHRRIERCPGDAAGCDPADKLVLFEVVDEAKVEDTGTSAKVVTASPPFPGYLDNFGGWDLSGAPIQVTSTYLFLMWSYESLLPARPLPGLVTGKVLRQKWLPGAASPEYVPVPGAEVSGLDAADQPLSAKDGGTLARTQADGTFALWDLTYTGGVVELLAKDQNQEAKGSAFEVVEPALARYGHAARANLTFPAIEPPPVPPQVEVAVLRAADGKSIGGITIAGTQLLIAFRNNTPQTDFTINGAEIGGQTLAVRRTIQGDPAGFSHVASETFTPPQAGTYTVTTTAIPPTGSPVTTSATFRVLAAGNEVDTDESSAPKVITARTVPKANAKGVPVTVFPQVAFTEPVKGVPGNVRLLDSDGAPVAIRISGVAPGSVPIEEVTDPAAVVTALTIQPLAGLKYGAGYRLVLSEGIVDLDASPKNLASFESSFTTFGPVGVGGSEDQTGSPGIVVLGDRAYLAKTNAFVNGNVVVYDVADPVAPAQVGESDIFAPRPYDIVGEASENGERLIAVATGSTTRSKPASVLFFDASTDTPRLTGAASLTNNAFEGFISRIAVKGAFAYTATVRKGIQVVDIQAAQAAWASASADPSGTALQTARTKLNTDGEGFGQDAVVQTISIPLKNEAQGTHWYLNDIKVADVGGQTLAVVVGEPGLVVADPLSGSLRFPSGGFPGTLTSADGSHTLGWGQAVALGRLSDRDVAVVVTRTHLATVDLTDAANPRLLDALDLSPLLAGLAPVDVILKDATALVSVQNTSGDTGFVLLVSLADLARPQYAGQLASVGGRLALGEGSLSGLLFSTARSVFGGADLLGGIRVAALDRLMLVESVTPTKVVADLSGRAAESFEAKYRLIPEDPDVVEGTVEVLLDGVVRSSTAVRLVGGRGSSSFPLGTIVGRENPAQIRITARDASGLTHVSPPKRIPVDIFRLGPEGPVTVSADEERMDLLGYGPGLIEAAAAADAKSRTVQWSLAGGGSLLRTQSTGTEGVFANTLTLPTQAGVTVVVTANLPGSGPIAQTAPILVEPGVADSLELSADRTAVPADRASTVTLKVTARDRFGNLVEDGTPVVWSLDGDGALASAESVTAGGEATTVYQVGAGTGPQKVVAKIDDVEKVIEIATAAVDVEVNVEPPVLEPGQVASVRVRASSGAGTPADGAPIAWLATWGRLTGSVPNLTSGEAVASFTAGPSAGVAYLLAGVGQTTGQTRVPVVGTSFHAQLEPPYFTGNQVGDGTIEWEGADGEVASCPYSGSAMVKLRRGEPGATVTAVLGGPDEPNVEPIAWYTMNEVAGSVADIYHDHDGASSGVVSLDADIFRAGRASYRFDGTGLVTVPDHPSFALASGLQVSAAVYVSGAGEGEIVSKDGAFTLRLSSGRPAFAVSVAGAAEEIVFPSELAPGVWHTVAGSYSAGVLRVMVGGEVEERALSGSLDTSTAPVVIGRSFTGNLDDVKVYDLSRPRLVAFAGGAEEIEVTLDANGEALVPLYSLGNLRTGSPQVGSRTIRFRLRPGDPTRPPLQTDVDECVVRDGISCDVGRFMDGVITGTAENKQEATGSFIGSFVPFWGDPRDLVLSLIDIARGRGSRALNGMAAIFSVIGVLTTFGGPLDAMPTTLKIGSRNLAKAGLEEKAVAVFLERSIEAAKGGAKWEESRPLFEWLTNFSKAQRLAEIAPVITSARRLDDLLHLVRHFDDADKAVELLIRIKKAHGLEAMEGVLEITGKKGLKWSEEGFEGIGVWLAKSRRPESSTILKVIEGAPGLGGTGAAATGENLFRWVKRTEGLPGIDEAIRIGNTGPRGVQGLYHQLEEVTERGISNFSGLEHTISAPVNGKVLERTVDAAHTSGQLFEMKSFRSYTSPAAHDALKQLADYLSILQQQGPAALERARLTYIFRGPLDAAYRAKMLKTANEVLRRENRRFFTEANIIFRGRPVPF